MLNRLMITAATAALIAGTGFANAQGMNREAPSAGAGMQQSAPSSDRGSSAATPMNRDSAPEQGMKSSQSEEKMQPKGGKTQQTQGDMKAGPKGDNKGEKSAQDTNTNNNMKGEKPNAMSSEKAGERGAAGSNMKADSKTPTDTKAGSTNTENKTTGNAATSATAAPPAEKQTQIASAIRSEKIEETTNVNFEINVGTRVPTSVHFYPLPPRIVEIYPEWRGYDVIRVHGRYVIIRPQTHEIVYIIEG